MNSKPYEVIHCTLQECRNGIDLALELIEAMREPHLLAEEHGGTWGEHPDALRSDWAEEAANGDTSLGYWDWALNQIATLVEEES